MADQVALTELFELAAASSGGIGAYRPGPLPFVTSAAANNGVVAYVTPLAGDRVFAGPAICVSALGQASVHLGAFLPKGNGGDSLTVLLPRQDAALGPLDLIGLAAAFNLLHRWRFSYGRKCSLARLAPLALPADLPPVAPLWLAETARAEAVTRRVGGLAGPDWTGSPRWTSSATRRRP
jgi:hypothetical protein